MRKRSLGFLEGWLSIGINTALFVVKYWVGTRAGSVAMVADSWHTLSDSITSGVVIAGFWLSSRPADAKHPFGHGRAELIASIIIGTLLAVVGAEFLLESIKRLQHYRAASFSAVAIAVFIVSALLKEGIARFSFWAGKKINSRALIADGWHHRSDAIASALIVVGGAAGKNIWWMDGALGIGVSFLILFTGYDIIRTAGSSSLGEAHSEDLDRRIRGIIAAAAPDARETHHLHVHWYGDHMEVTVHLRLAPDMHVEEAHRVASVVERALRRELRAEATVHIEPESGQEDRTGSPGR